MHLLEGGGEPRDCGTWISARGTVDVACAVRKTQRPKKLAGEVT